MVIYALEAAGIEFEELREELSGKLGIRLTKRGLIEKLIREGSVAIRKEFGLKEKKQQHEDGGTDGK